MIEIDRISELDIAIATEKVCRGTWFDGERACLLATMFPDVGQMWSTRFCPADQMPEWFAKLTVIIDDNGTIGNWERFIKEYARLLRASAAFEWCELEDRLKVRVIQAACDCALIKHDLITWFGDELVAAIHDRATIKSVLAKYSVLIRQEYEKVVSKEPREANALWRFYSSPDTAFECPQYLWGPRFAAEFDSLIERFLELWQVEIDRLVRLKGEQT